MDKEVVETKTMKVNEAKNTLAESQDRKTEPGFTRSAVYELPPMPEQPPTLALSVTAVLDHDFRLFSTGNCRMCYERVDVSDNNKKLGTVAAAIPSGVVVSKGQKSWFISARELWNAVERAEESAALVAVQNNEGE